MTPHCYHATHNKPLLPLLPLLLRPNWHLFITMLSLTCLPFFPWTVISSCCTVSHTIPLNHFMTYDIHDIFTSFYSCFTCSIVFFMTYPSGSLMTHMILHDIFYLMLFMFSHVTVSSWLIFQVFSGHWCSFRCCMFIIHDLCLSLPCFYIRSLSVMLSRIFFHVLYGRYPGAG